MRSAQKMKTTNDLLVMPTDDLKVYELLEGEIFASEYPSLQHQSTIVNLIGIFDKYVLEHSFGKFWFSPVVIFDDYNSAIPDLVFIAKDRIPQIASGIHIVGAPDLAIEIMSPGTENVRRDHIVKRQTYAKYGVKEYWIVELLVEVIEITRLQKNILASVGTFRNEDEISSPLLPDLSFTVKDVFRK